MKIDAPIIIVAVLAAMNSCSEPVATVSPIQLQELSSQELDLQLLADEAWDAAEESRTRMAKQYEHERDVRWGLK